MGDRDLPTQDTTVTANNIQVINPRVRYDKGVTRTRDGYIKIAQLIFGALGAICIQFTNFSIHYHGKFFTTVSLLGICITGILLILYLFHVVEKCYNMPWNTIELLYCLIMTVLYLICSCMVISLEISAFGAAAFFGFSVMVLYIFEAFFKFQARQSGELAQGERRISKISSPDAVGPERNDVEANVSNDH